MEIEARNGGFGFVKSWFLPTPNSDFHTETVDEALGWVPKFQWFHHVLSITMRIEQ